MRRWSGEIRLERPPERASVAPRAEPAAGSGAVLAGATVGLIESLQVLSRSFGTRDYSGMVYAIVLYGAAGAAAGLPLIGATALLRVGVGHPLDAARVFTGCFLLVAAALGTMVAAAHGAGGAAGPLPSIGLMSLAAILFWFIVKNALQKTFFGALLRPSVAAGAYLSLLGFTLLFALGTRLNNEARASLTPRPVADALRDRPNLLVLVADGLSARLLDEAPELVRARAFADGATRFDAAFAHSNDPRASIASLLVAAPPCVHGVRGGEAVLPDWADTFPEVLQRHGYTTGAIVTGLDLTASFNFDQGFDTFRFLRPIWPLRMSEAAVRLAIYRPLRATFVALWPQFAGGEHVRRSAEAVSGEAIDWLRRFGRDRFLLIAQTRDLADPAGEPEAAVRARWDEAFGQLIDAVATEGLDGNTVIVLAGSHGDAARPMSDAALRVGLVIRGLPAPPTGRVRDIVRLADLGPALVDVAGGSPGFGWSGVSLLREYALRGPEDRVVLAEAQREDEALSAVRDGQWKWTRTESARGDRDAVYFLPADPDEAEDLTRTASGASSLDRRIAELRAIRDRACMPPRRPLSQDECATLRRLGYDDRADDRCRDVL